jgi:hypothetical protein
MIHKLWEDMSVGIQWVTGNISEVTPKTPNSNVIAKIKGDNGQIYLLRQNGFAPEDRAHAVRLGDRVKFEDRQGYVLDLRQI